MNIGQRVYLGVRQETDAVLHPKSENGVLAAA